MTVRAQDRRRFRVFTAFCACLRPDYGGDDAAMAPECRHERCADDPAQLSLRCAAADAELDTSCLTPPKRARGDLDFKVCSHSPVFDPATAECSDMSTLPLDSAFMLSGSHDFLGGGDTLMATRIDEHSPTAPPDSARATASSSFAATSGVVALSSAARTSLPPASPDCLHPPELLPVLMSPRTARRFMLSNSVFGAPGAAGLVADEDDAETVSVDGSTATLGGDTAELRECMCGGMPTEGGDGDPRHADADGGGVELQLDDLLLYGEGVLMGKYRLLGLEERRVGSKQIVQFASSARRSSALTRGGGEPPPPRALQYVVKFYRDPRHFERERQLYSEPRFRGAMAPVVEMVGNQDGAVRDPFGRALPPFVVMERGVRLDDWAGAQPTHRVVEALVQVAAAVAALHAAGLVHGGLRPSCILWMERTQRWEVTDLTTAVPAGQRFVLASTSPSMVYEAPEVVQARLAKRDCCTAHRALDVWALGTIAFELLTGSQLFNQDKRHNKQVIRAMTGDGMLPWESAEWSSLSGGMHVGRLGFMRDGIMGMLARNSKHRPRLQLVHEVWRRRLLARSRQRSRG